MRIVLALLGSYLAGSLPIGFVTARWVAGMDIRRLGSGNIGATNVARYLGLRWGLFVLALDVLKGWGPTVFFPAWLTAAETTSTHLDVGCGLAAILGHIFPCWLGFRGGKGVATGLGVALALAPQATGIAAGLFFATFAATRLVALCSIVAAVGFAIAELWLLRPNPFGEQTWSLALFSVAVPLLIVIRHESNIRRMWRGEEERFRLHYESDESTQPEAEATAGEKTELTGEQSADDHDDPKRDTSMPVR